MLISRKTLHRAALFTLAAVVAIGGLANENGTQLALAEHQPLGAILVDGAGSPLYAYAQDQQGESTCTGECVQLWPPLVGADTLSVGEGVDAALVGSTERADGASQVTYGGWPLYTYVNDADAEGASGHGLNDMWFAVGPDGNLLAATADEAGGGDVFAQFMADGAKVFSQTCAVCHGQNGNEALASHVAILESNSRLGNAKLVLRRIIHGSGYMPAFGAALSDHEVAAVATFVRNSFGNEYGFVGEEEAASSR